MDPRLQEMLDHFEIRKTLALYCHGCDRADADLLGSVYTGTDSFDDHGIVKACGPEYAERMTELLKDTTEVVSHTLGQSLIQVDGDTAKAETFFIALLRVTGEDGEPRLSQLTGRYVDQLERRGESWKIKHRVAVHDTSITWKIEEDFLETNMLVRGGRDSSDPGVALMGIAHLNGSSLTA